MMKVLITDYKDELDSRNLDYEVQLFKEGLGEDAQVEIYAYEDKEGLMEKGKEADGILTAFVTMDKEVLDACKNLKAISINATGYNFIDFDETVRRGINLCAIGEYCTAEVADQTIAMMLCLAKNIKAYDCQVSEEKRWEYASIDAAERTSAMTLGIVGCGKIGKAVAKRAKAFGMRVMASDPLLTEEMADELGIEKVEPDVILREAHVITNHMNANETNIGYFDREKFSRMEKHPVFLNLARGVSMVEKDLEEALDKGWIRACGLDVLESESPDLENCPFLNRRNVIITPHSSFYSRQAFEDLQRISCENLIHCLRGEQNLAFKIVNNG